MCETFFSFFPPSSVACVLLLHHTAEMSRSIVVVARLLGRSRLAAPTCSVPSLNFRIGGIVIVDDGSVLCERHMIMNMILLVELNKILLWFWTMVGCDDLHKLEHQ